MFKAKTAALKNENNDLKQQVATLNAALIKSGHQHDFIETDRKLLNGYQASNGCSSEYNVTRVCTTCGKKETNFELGW